MKICLIVDDYMPNSIKIAAKMMHELAIEFTNNGHQVSVITPDSNITSKVDKLILDNVEIYRFKTGQIKNTAKIHRAINETLLSFNAWRSCKDIIQKNKHDLIIYYSPTIFFGPLIKKLKREWNAPSYLILRDIFPQWVIDNGILNENSLITKYFKYFEKLNYINADRIGLMSKKNLEWFNQHYDFDCKVEILYNWASDSTAVNNATPFRKKFNLENKIIYFYGGNIGHAQDMMNLIRLAKNMQKYKKSHFVFLGEGDEVKLVHKAIHQDNISNITLLPSVSQSEFKNILSEIDVGLFSLNYKHKTHNFPGKLLGYMCESKPILGSVNPDNDLKHLIESAEAGYIEVNGEDEKLYNKAIKLLNSDSRKHIGENANNLLHQTFSVQSAAKKILKIVDTI